MAKHDRLRARIIDLHDRRATPIAIAATHSRQGIGLSDVRKVLEEARPLPDGIEEQLAAGRAADRLSDALYRSARRAGELPVTLVAVAADCQGKELEELQGWAPGAVLPVAWGFGLES